MNGVIRDIANQLRAAYDEDEALALAYWIVEEKTSLTRSDILIGKEIAEIADLDGIIRRLLQHEPIQYIFGHTEWMGLDLMVSPATLIPRPETAELLRLLPTTTKPLRVLDIGTGSGCIAIAVKRAHPHWQVSAVDISEEAMAVAQENAHRCHTDIAIWKADILSDEIEGMYDLVISNPPYIRQSEQASMAANVLAYEPHNALFVPDNDPLLFYRRIAQMGIGKQLVFEINEALGAETAAMLSEYGYIDITIHPDSYGKDRFITGRLPE